MLTQTIPTEPLQKAVNRNDDHESISANIIKKYTLLASGATLIPYEYVDVAASAVLQTLMVRELCQLYNVPYEGKIGSLAVWSSVGSLVSKAISEVINRVVVANKSESFFNLSSIAITATYMATVGEFYKIHLRDGGTLDDVTITDLGGYLVEEIQRGDISINNLTNPKTLMNQLIS